MRRFSSRALLLLLPTFAAAVSLSDFTPRISDLPSACSSVYTQQISGCSGTDFSSGTCSQACINGLNAMVAPVQSACAYMGLTGENIVVAFLAGQGPSSLCQNAGSFAVSSSAASTPSPAAAPSSTPADTSIASSTEVLSSSSMESTSLQVAPSSSAATSSTNSVTTTTPSTTVSPYLSAPTSSATVASSESTGLAVDTSSAPPAPANTGTSTTSSSGSSRTSTNDGSGGGSPFDSNGNTSAGNIILPATCLALAAAFAALGALR